jgi:hypothetical protein
MPQVPQPQLTSPVVGNQSLSDLEAAIVRRNQGK